MPWTRPKTWSSEPLTSLDLNTYVRDNQNHLKDRLDNSASRIISAARDYETTAREWVDVDATQLSLTLDTHGGALLLGFTATVHNSGHAKTCYFNIAVDDSNYFPGDGVTGLTNAASQDTGKYKPLSLVVLITGLSAGPHTFKLRWKTVSSNIARMNVSSMRPQFWVKEL